MAALVQWLGEWNQQQMVQLSTHNQHRIGQQTLLIMPWMAVARELHSALSPE